MLPENRSGPAVTGSETGGIKMPEVKTGILLKKNARIGIINRGEPACRFIRSVKEYNSLNSCSLKSISFYISKEEDSLFVRNSDESFLLGEKEGSLLTGAGNYLDHDLLVAALKKAECDAVWVGWGFVSEDSRFAEKIENEGMIFLGPSSRAMELLGDKITAKELAERCSVPVLPWSRKPVGSLEEAQIIAGEIGYPVIIKAANAGGGRGIRVVKRAEELPSLFNSAREETVRITGNDILFIECFVEKGRHLEVQMIADFHGNVNTLGVRDCSVQRNNQKIIEETPPPGLSRETTAGMEEASIRLIKEAGYTGAGTVEYLYDLKREQYYFMEVNTRLQVEHPITEILYGFDLVKGQIDVAMGKEVLTENRMSAGSVIEVRLNAEDPYSGFSPSPGDVLLFVPPAGPGIRVDSGIEQNSSIPSDFDSMIAKIIAYGKDRDEALARIKRALEELKIKIKNGTTNRTFILDLLNSRQIIEGGTHTGFVEQFLENRNPETPVSEEEASLLASAVEIYLRQRSNELENFKNQVSRSGTPRDFSPAQGEKADLTYNGCSYSFFVKYTGGGYYHINYLDRNLVCRYRKRGEESVIEVGRSRFNMILTDRGDTIQCDVNGLSIPVIYQTGGVIKSRSPAVVLSVNKEKGDSVGRGEPLIVLEAMKMEMIISAPAAGIISSILVSEGEQIAAGQPLALIEDEAADNDKTQGIPVRFSSALDDGEMKREWIERELNAYFLGYDNERSASAVWKDFLESAETDEKLNEAVPAAVINILDMYLKIEKLFSAAEIETELFSRPVAYPEMMSHYFRTGPDKEKGLPEGFLDDIKSAADCFSAGGKSSRDEDPFSYFFNIFRSHKNIKNKDEILKSIFSSFDRISFPEYLMEKLLDHLDRIINLFPSSVVYDYAVSARYSVFDRKKLEEVKNKSRTCLYSLIENVSVSENIQSSDIEFIRDSGSYIVPDLINLSLSDDPVKQEHGLRFSAIRFNRDRKIQETSGFRYKNMYLYSAEIEKSSAVVKSYITAADVKDLDKLETDTALYCAGSKTDKKVLNELLLFIRCQSEDLCEEIFTEITDRLNPAEIEMTAGIYNKDNGTICFRSFRNSGKGWKEELRMRDFSPLQYRELKVERFSGFSFKMLYRNEGVFTAELSSGENPEDVRLVSFVDVSELLPSETDNSERLRLVMIESLFSEAANAVRSLQSGYKKRLEWNRIILHNRTLLGIRFKSLQDYGLRMMKQAGDIGLEKLTVLTRRKRWSEKFPRPVEIEFIPVAGNQISIRTGSPSDSPVNSVDRYTAGVISSRRKKTVYPYEIIKLLTTSASSSLGIHAGIFEEYDIEVDQETDTQKTVSVKDRAAGLNSSNIVFGIIENILSETGTPVRRVLILSDATKDMGSLAEGEARRVTAAVDLAERENLPVEWIPVSSGARIDMVSGTENLDWTAAVLRRIIEFTQNGGEINIIVSSANVGAQSYWNAESTMLMHTKGLLIMTDNASMLLTGKRALDFSGSVSGETNTDIGGCEKIMAPNGQAQIRVSDFSEGLRILFRHYRYTYISSEWDSPLPLETKDPSDRDITEYPYNDPAGQGFTIIGDIFDPEKNPERKKPFEMRQLMNAVIDSDAGYLERWQNMHDAETSIVWETQTGGIPVGMIGIESRSLSRIGDIPPDGPESFSGGTLYPLSSKKTARALNAFSGKVPVVILANLSGFDGSPESLRKLQLEYGAEIGRAVVNFKGPLIFIVTARYHGGAYVVFSKKLNPSLTVAAVKGSFASVIGGAPAAAVVFPRKVMKDTYADSRVKEASVLMEEKKITGAEFAECCKKVYNEKQKELGKEFDGIHSVERAEKVGSIDDIVSPEKLRPYIIDRLFRAYS